MTPQQLFKKIQSRLEPIIGQFKANQAASFIKENVESMLRQGSNKLFLEKEYVNYLSKLFENLEAKEIIQSKEKIKEKFIIILKQYTENLSSVESIANLGIKLIVDNINNNRNYSSLERMVAILFFDHLLLIENKMQSVYFDEIEGQCFYVIHPLIWLAEHKYGIIYSEDWKVIDTWIDETLQPIEKKLEKQRDARDKVYFEISEFIRPLYSVIKIDLDRRKEEEKRLASERAFSLSKDEKKVHEIKSSNEIDTRYEHLRDTELTKLLSQWLKGKSHDLIAAIEFDIIKLFENTRELTSTSPILKAIEARSNPIQIDESQKNILLNKLVQFLIEAKQHKIEILLQKELDNMDLKNLLLRDAKDNFRTFMFSLPSELTEAFINQDVQSFDKVVKLKSLGIQKWEPSPYTIKVFESLNLEHVANYAILYRAPHHMLSSESRELFLKQNRELRDELSELIDGGKISLKNQDQLNHTTKTSGIVFQKVHSLRKLINSSKPSIAVLNVLLKSCNLETLQESLVNCTKKNSVVDQIHTQIEKLTSRTPLTFAQQIQQVGGSPLFSSVPSDVTLSPQNNKHIVNSF